MSVPPQSSPPVFGAQAAPRPAPRTALLIGAVLGVAGVVAVLVGTFLPWLSSGGVLRNSYSIVGIVGRLGLLGDGFGATALSWWPFLGPVAMIGLIAGIVRLFRTAAVMTLLFGMLTGVIGGGVLAVAGGHAGAGVTLAYTGPVVTVVGALAAATGAITVLLALRRRRRHRARITASRTISSTAEPPGPTPRRNQDSTPGVPGWSHRPDVATTALEQSPQ
ncbi:hypothetical protein ABIB25_000576 [Nakamurella sp. UYEF19]|uniref:hypothetical protein n=1 Tax=Nakamurella sp. UYEF19 TaxID=1756392 RepID=UPI00339989AF